MPKVNSIIRKMNTGSTQPFLVSCDDSKQYVMKCINNTTNGKALFNELFASRLMCLLDIDSPKTQIAKLPQNIVDTNVLLLNNHSQDGNCFISELVKGASLGINPITAKSITNEDIFPEIIFFDALVMNSDRADNKGNWFVEKHSQKLIALDHTNIFRIAQIWDSVSLQQDTRNPPEIINDLDDTSYHLLADEYKRRKPNSKHPFSPMKRKLQGLTDTEIKSCFLDIPREWDISSNDLNAAQNFICFQIEHADDILNQLEIQFDFNKGGFLHG